MPQINDQYFRVLGRGSVNNLLLQYYQANGATSDDINDAEREFLELATAASGPLNDLWYAYLTGLGHTGALPDMKLAFWGGLPDFAIEVVTFLGEDVTFLGNDVTYPA